MESSGEGSVTHPHEFFVRIWTVAESEEAPAERAERV
jgi:hypothetical protein